VEGSYEHVNEPFGYINIGKFFNSCTIGGFLRRAQVREGRYSLETVSAVAFQFLIETLIWLFPVG
jgi:hypothetical protein